MNGLAFLLHVIEEKVPAEGVGGCKVGFPAADFGDLLDKAHQVKITGQHEGIDENAGLAAVGHLLDGLTDHQRIKPERILIDVPILLREGGRLSIRNHDDLLHIFPLSRQDSLCQAQSFPGIGVIGSHLNSRQLAKWNFFG